MTNATASIQVAHAVPWMVDGLFPHDDQPRTVTPASVEVRPVLEADGQCEAMTRGDTANPDGTPFKPSFWSVYLIDSDGYANAVADLPNEQAADALAESLILTYPGMMAAQGIHAPIRSWEIADAAQCLWEAYLQAEYPDGLAPEWSKAVEEMRESDGTSTVRDMFRELARPCHVAYVRAVELEGYDDSFDWQWCPAFLAGLDWSGGGVPTVRKPVDDFPEGEETPTDVACELAEIVEALLVADARSDAPAHAAALQAGALLMARIGITVPNADGEA